MLADKIWYYIGSMVDNSNLLPDEDMIYTEFQKSFELYGHNPDIIAETVQSYVSASDLTGVDIRWEGEIPWKPCNESLRTALTTLDNSKKIS